MITITPSPDWLRAYWYAAGYRDARPQARSLDPVEFAEKYLRRLARYETGESSYMPSVPNAYAEWLQDAYEQEAA